MKYKTTNENNPPTNTFMGEKLFMKSCEYLSKYPKNCTLNVGLKSNCPTVKIFEKPLDKEAKELNLMVAIIKLLRPIKEITKEIKISFC